MTWGAWSDDVKPLTVDGWRGDQDLLANTLSGAALPVGSLEIRRHSPVKGEATSLATLKGGDPLLSRVTTDRGGIYFCGTTPAPSDSSLATNGVVLYVLIQRALSAGAEALSSSRQLVAGDPSGENPEGWKRIAGEEGAMSTDYALHTGRLRFGRAACWP